MKKLNLDSKLLPSILKLERLHLEWLDKKVKFHPINLGAYIVNLRLVSENYFVNQNTKDSVSFQGKPHEIVEKIISEYLPGELVINEKPHDEEYKIVYGFKQPLHMINQMMTNATPTDSEDDENDAGFLFYETLMV